MRVEELMTTDVLTCQPEDTLARAAQIMWDHDCGAVPVVDGAGRVVGMVTDRDGFMAAYTRGLRLDEVTVGSVMSPGVHTCRPQDTVHMAETMLRDARLHRLPVVDAKGRLLGILSLADLARHVHRSDGRPDDGVSGHSLALTLGAICEVRRATRHAN